MTPSSLPTARDGLGNIYEMNAANLNTALRAFVHAPDTEALIQRKVRIASATALISVATRSARFNVRSALRARCSFCYERCVVLRPAICQCVTEISNTFMPTQQLSNSTIQVLEFESELPGFKVPYLVPFPGVADVSVPAGHAIALAGERIIKSFLHSTDSPHPVHTGDDPGSDSLGALPGGVSVAAIMRLEAPPEMTLQGIYDLTQACDVLLAHTLISYLPKYAATALSQAPFQEVWDIVKLSLEESGSKIHCIHELCTCAVVHHCSKVL